MKNQSRIIALYRGGMAVKDIAREYCCSDTTIRKILKKRNVKLRQCKYKIPVYESYPEPKQKHTWNVEKDLRTYVCKGELWPECSCFPKINVKFY